MGRRSLTKEAAISNQILNFVFKDSGVNLLAEGGNGIRVLTGLDTTGAKIDSSQLSTVTGKTSKKTGGDYVQGEILVKFKAKAAVLKPSSQALSRGVGFDKAPVSFEDIDRQDSPKVLVKLHERFPIKTIDKVFKKNFSPKIKKVSSIDISRNYRIIFSKDVSVIAVLQFLNQSSEIEYAEPNFILEATAINDPYYLDQQPPAPERALPAGSGGWNPSYDYQWGLKKINIEPAWDKDSGSQNVVVAVIDTGVDYNHPELEGRVIKGYDFVNDDNNPIDDNGHGTHVAGIIAAVKNNQIGMAGVSNSQILAIKGLNYNGAGTINNLARAVRFAGDNGAKVINASWGGIGSSQTLKEAVDYVNSLGVIFVAAAGNNGADSRRFIPASYRNSLSVGSSDVADQTSDFSNIIGIDFIAPGGNSRSSNPGGDGFRNILSLRAGGTGSSSLTIDNDYLRQAGTSMAAPFVTGSVALLLGQNSSLTSEEIRSILRTSAFKPDEKIWTKERGYGRLDIGRAMSTGGKFNVARIQKPDNFVVDGDQAQITFIAFGNYFSHWVLELGIGLEPTIWTTLEEDSTPKQTPETLVVNISSLPYGDNTLRLRVLSNSPEVPEAEDRLVVSKTPPVKWSFFDPAGSFDFMPTVADINADGRKEVIIPSVIGRVYILKSDGSLKSTISLGDEKLAYLASSPIVADIIPNLPGKEILIMTENKTYSQNKKIRIFSSSGSEYIGDNWPFSFTYTGFWTRMAPFRVEDIDGNGSYEILMAADKVYVLDRFGSPLNSGWPKTLAGDFENSVYAGKFINPKSNQLQVLAINHQGQVFVLDYQGNQITTFNIPAFNQSTPSATISDLDGDGIQELITQYQSSAGMPTETNTDIAVYKPDGTLLWKKTIGIGGFNVNFPVPIVSDLNNDGRKDIITSDADGIWILDRDGNQLTGWPFYNQSNVLNFVTGDADGDTLPEIYFSQSYPPSLGVLDKGLIKFYFPFSSSFLFDAPSVGDIDGDNHLELIINAPFGAPLRVYDLGETKNYRKFNLQWPTYQYNERRLAADGICLKLDCDLNGDGQVNFADYSFMQSCYGKESPLGACRRTDVVCDGSVTLLDFSMLANKCPSIFCPELSCDLNGDGKANKTDGSFFRSCFGKQATGSCKKADVVCDNYITLRDFSLLAQKCIVIFR